MTAATFSTTPSRRRRASVNDPLKKITLQMSESVLTAIKSIVKEGESASANAFVEDAVRAMLRERRRGKVYAAYAKAANDPVFMKELDSDIAAFDPTLSDGLRGK